MIVNLGWKEIQKKYIREMMIRKNSKTNIQQFITEAALIKVSNKGNNSFCFTFLFNNKEYKVMVAGEGACSMGAEMYSDFGIRILKELSPYLHEYVYKYTRPLTMES